MKNLPGEGRAPEVRGKANVWQLRSAAIFFRKRTLPIIAEC